MGWRTVVINSLAKISCKNGYICVQGEEVTMIHLSEVDSLIIATAQATITAFALWQLAENKIRVIFCDERRNPYGELSLYYGCHNSSKKIKMQLGWEKSMKEEVFRRIIQSKIRNQAAFLRQIGANDRGDELACYAECVEPGDPDNKEGMSARLYFQSLFGAGFSRDENSSVNARLNYGYSVILSAVNREVAVNGCLSQLGLKHANEYNAFNFSCDLMEPFRVEVDKQAYLKQKEEFTSSDKYDLQAITAKVVKFGKADTTLGQAIKIAVKSVIDVMNSGIISDLRLYEL